MAKIALLVGVSEYEPGLNPLPAAVKDLDALREVLVHPDIGGFAESDITLLKNPNRQVMEEAIYTLFADRQRDDLLLFFFSGHGIKDDKGALYLATRDTRKAPRGELISPTAVSANFVHERMDRSRSKRQIVILDSCFSGAFAEGMLAKDDGTVDVRNQLGGEGRAILTSSSSTQYSFEQEGEELSLYSRFLIKGIQTGEADQDGDGVVSTDELHEYAKGKVREVKPEMNPEIIVTREGFKIRIAKVPPGDPVEKYRKEVARFINRGEISLIGRSSLDWLRTKLGLEATIAKAIEDEVLEPVRKEFREKLQRYEQIFTEVVQREETLDNTEQEQLKYFQQNLGLRNEDTMPIQAKVSAKFKAHKQHLQEYEQAFNEALRQEYPLTATKRGELQQMQQRLELTDADTFVIEERITTEVETHHRNLQQYKQAFNDAVQQEYPLSEAKRGELRQYQQDLSLTDIDVTSIEAQITNEFETYQKKLQQYEQALVKATQCKHPLNEGTRQQMQQTWQTLGLFEADVQSIEAPIFAEIEKHQANLRQYEREFTDATQQEYPLSVEERLSLQQRQQQLNLNGEDVAPIETRIITEIEDHIHKLRQYEQVLTESVNYEYPLSEATREELQRFQQILELRDEDIAQIEDQITAKRQQEQEEHESKLSRYEQEFSKAIQAEYPLSEATQDELQAFQQSLELKAEDAERIEQPIRAEAEAKYQEKLRQEAERRQQEQKKAEYENKLLRYEQEFSKAVQGIYPLSEAARYELQAFQQSLELKAEDVEWIEQPIRAEAEAKYQEKLRQEAAERQRQLDLQAETQRQLEQKRQQEQEEHESKLCRYKQEFSKAVQGVYPLSEAARYELQAFQQSLELNAEDVERIEQPIRAEAETKYQEKLRQEAERRQQEQERTEYENKLQQYEQEFTKLIQAEYPLSQNTLETLKTVQQQLGLKTEDVERIEQPIRAEAETKYQEKLRQEAERQQQEQKKAEYKNKLLRYEQEFTKLIQAEYPLNQFALDRLKEFQQGLGLKDEDVAPIQKREHQRYEYQLVKTKVVDVYHLVKTRLLVGAVIAILSLSGIAIWVMTGQTYRPEVTAQKPEVTAQKPEVKAPKPEVKAPKPEVKVQPKPEVKVQPKPEIKVQPKPEIKVQPKPEIKIQPKPEIKIQPKPEIKIQPKPEVEVQPKVGVLEPKVEVQQPEVKVQEPKVGVLEPKVEVQQPEVKVQEPKVGLQKPEVKEIQKLAFENLPVLTHVYTNNTSATNSYARYFFEVNIPQNSGAPLGGLAITIPLDITVPSSGNISVTDNTGQPIAFKMELQQRTVLLTFSQPVSPGQKITVQFSPMSNPTTGGTFQFEISALPPGNQPRPQFLGFGRLTFYRGGH